MFALDPVVYVPQCGRASSANQLMGYFQDFVDACKSQRTGSLSGGEGAQLHAVLQLDRCMLVLVMQAIGIGTGCLHMHVKCMSKHAYSITARSGFLGPGMQAGSSLCT